MKRSNHAALVVAILALIVALGGTAIAAKHYLITRKNQIAPKVLKQLSGASGAAGAQGPSGSTGQAGANGSNGIAGTNGTNGTDGTDGTSATVAFAFIEASGTIDPARSKGVAVSENVGPGDYCVGFNGLTPASSPLLATPAVGENAAVTVDYAPVNCNNGEYEILTRVGGMSTNIAFVLAVP